MNQRDLILKWLKSGRSITPVEAFNALGCFRLAARIHELRERGHEIDCNMQHGIRGKVYARYWLSGAKRLGPVTRRSAPTSESGRMGTV
jgi:hypothetical protein